MKEKLIAVTWLMRDHQEGLDRAQTTRDRFIRDAYREGMTQAEIGEYVDLSDKRISQIVNDV